MNWIIFAQLLGMGGGGTVQPGPGTGEYLERFDVYGGPSRRMDVNGSPLGTRISVRGGDGDNE